MRRYAFIMVVSLSLLVCFSNYASALPSEPPPPGKIWVEAGGTWTLVVEPPGDGPYIWRDSKWIIDPTPPPADSEWIPAHWAPKGWVPGHWKAVPAPGPGAHWVPGHWKHNKWVPGHWAGDSSRGKNWVPGHRGPRGHWIPGHWK